MTVCVSVCMSMYEYMCWKRSLKANERKLNETRRENHKQIIKSATRNRRTEAKAANITLSSVQHIHVYNTYTHINTYIHTYIHTRMQMKRNKGILPAHSPRWKRAMIHGRVYQQTRFMSCLSCSDCACQGSPKPFGSQARGNTRSHTHTHTRSHAYVCTYIGHICTNFSSAPRWRHVRQHEQVQWNLTHVSNVISLCYT